MNIRPLIYFLLCHLLIFSSIPKDKNDHFNQIADSLSQQFKNRIDSANTLIKEYKYISVADSLIDLNIENDYLIKLPKLYAETIYLKGDILISENKLEDAKKWLSSALSTVNSRNDSLTLRKALIKLGETHSRLSELEEAESIFLKAEDLFTEEKDNYGLAQCYRHLSIIKGKQRNFAKSIDYLYKSLYFIEKIGDHLLLTSTTINLGIIYSEIKNYEKAEYNLLEGLKLAKKHNDLSNIIFAEYHLSSVLYNKGLMNQAIRNANQLLGFTKENNLEKYNYRPLLIMAKAYLELCQLDKAEHYCSLILKLENQPAYITAEAQIIACRIAYEKALYEQVISDCSEIIENGLNILNEKLFEIMYNAHLNLNNYKAATYYGDLFRKATAQSQSDNFNTFLAKQEIDFSKERVNIQKLLTHKNWVIGLLSLTGVLLFLTTTLFVLANQSKKKYNAELKEQVKLRTLELKQSNLDLARFAHIASHDIKAPILTIKAFSELLEAEAQKSNNKNITKFTKMINSSSIEASNLVDETLEFSKFKRDYH